MVSSRTSRAHTCLSPPVLDCSPILSSFQVILLEHIIMCRLVTGHKATALQEVGRRGPRAHRAGRLGGRLNFLGSQGVTWENVTWSSMSLNGHNQRFLPKSFYAQGTWGLEFSSLLMAVLAPLLPNDCNP